MLLVGTNHFDLDGPSRLEHILRAAQPRSITVEFNATQEEVQQMIQETEVITDEDIEPVASYFRIPHNPAYFRLIRELFQLNGYEVKTAATYANTSRIPISYIDSLTSTKPEEVLSDMGLSEPERQLAYMVVPVFEMLPIEIPNVTYEQAREIMRDEATKMYHGEIKSLTQTITTRRKIMLPEDHPLNEYFLGAPIDKMKQAVAGQERNDHFARRIHEIKPDMHIIGAGHLMRSFPGYPVLTDSLLDLKPQIVMLCDAFKYHLTK